MKNNNIKIIYQQMGKDGLELVAPLWIKLKEHHQERSKYFKGHYDQLTWEIRKSGLLEKSQKGAMLVDIAEDKSKDEIIGYCVSTITAKREGELDSIFVEENYRKHHIGDSFMKNALKWFAANSVSKIIISVAGGNEEAFGFYSRYGFYPRETVLMQGDNQQYRP